MYKADTESLSAIDSLIHQYSQLIFSKSMRSDYGKSTIEAPRLWIRLQDDDFVCLYCDWYECEDTLLDFAVISARKSTFKREKDTSVFSFGEQKRYKSIRLLTISHPEEFELKYEGGILVERSDGKRIIVAHGDSAFRNLVIEHDEKNIESFMERVVSIRDISESDSYR